MIETALVLAATAALGWAYLIGVQRIWERAGRHRSVRWWQPWCWAGGLMATAAVLTGPLDTMAETSLTAHMIQHMVLIAVAPPLLVAAGPVLPLLWALPEGAAKRRLARWSRSLTHRHHASRGMRWAATAFGLHTAALWGWHAPDAYQAALSHPLVHAAEHLSFLATAVFLWWTLGAAGRRSAYGFGVVILFFVALQGTALGAAMTLAPHPWYARYTVAGPRWGLSPAEDQQLAGVIMWGVAGFAYVAAAAALFAAWLVEVERRSPARGGYGVSRAAPGAASPGSLGPGPVV